MAKPDYRIFDIPEVADITWEVCEGRGVATGDVMELYKKATEILAAMIPIQANGADLVFALMQSGQVEGALAISSHYQALMGYMERDAAEIFKFLVKRKFDFPDVE